MHKKRGGERTGSGRPVGKLDPKAAGKHYAFRLSEEMRNRVVAAGGGAWLRGLIEKALETNVNTFDENTTMAVASRMITELQILHKIESGTYKLDMFDAISQIGTIEEARANIIASIKRQALRL